MIPGFIKLTASHSEQPRLINIDEIAIVMPGNYAVSPGGMLIKEKRYAVVVFRNGDEGEAEESFDEVCSLIRQNRNM